MAAYSGGILQGDDLDELSSLVYGGFLDDDESFDQEITAIPSTVI